MTTQNQTTKTVYKIRNKLTGLYSMGGHIPRFTAKGKTWNTRGALSSHLSLSMGRAHTAYKAYIDCEIVEQQVVVTDTNTMSVAAWALDLKQRRESKAKQALVRAENRNKEIRRREYEKLHKEFGQN